MNNAALVSLDLGTIMAVVVLLVQPLKAVLEIFVPAGARAHDALVQLLALCVGVACSFLFVWGEGGFSRKAELELIISVILGIGGGAGGVGLFHMATALTAATPKGPDPDKDKSGQPPQG